MSSKPPSFEVKGRCVEVMPSGSIKIYRGSKPRGESVFYASGSPAAARILGVDPVQLWEEVDQAVLEGYPGPRLTPEQALEQGYLRRNENGSLTPVRRCIIDGDPDAPHLRWKT